MQRRSFWKTLAWAVVCVSLTCGWRAANAASAATAEAQSAVAAAPKPLQVATYALNAYKPELDGQWEGMLYASDGNVYFASSTHSGAQGAAFFKYNPNTKELTCLCKEITEVCGEDPKVNPQGKIHSPIVEANGWVYFTTHFSNERPGAAERYTGGHVIGCEMATGKFRDFGVAHPGYDIYSAVAVDPQRNVLYVMPTPLTQEQVRQGDQVEICRIDIASGKKETLAKLGSGEDIHNFWYFLDKRGDVWFTQGGNSGALYCIRGATGKVEEFDNALPLRRRLTTDEVAPENVQARRFWSWAYALPDGDHCLFAMDNDGMLWAFDSTKAADMAKAITPVKLIGPTGLGMCLAGDRVYYVQRANRRLGVKAPRRAPDIHLFSVQIGPEPWRPDGAAARAITDYGLIADANGRHPFRIESLAADGKGKVFMTGDWYLNPGDHGTTRYVRINGQDTWQEFGFEGAPRGQFFAVAELAAGLPGAHAEK